MVATNFLHFSYLDVITVNIYQVYCHSEMNGNTAMAMAMRFTRVEALTILEKLLLHLLPLLLKFGYSW